MEQFANNFRSTLAAPQTAGDLTLTPATLVGAPDGYPFRVLVGTEIEIVTALAAAGVWTVTRGAEGTTAAAHGVGALVEAIVTAGQLAAIWAAVEAAGVLPAPGAEGNVLTNVGGAWASALPPAGGGESPDALLAQYQWVNQAGATAVDSEAGLFVARNPSSGHNYSLLVKALPAGNYTATMRCRPAIYAVAAPGAGLVLRSSANELLTLFGIFGIAGGNRIEAVMMTNPTTGYSSQEIAGWNNMQPLWLRVVDDGINRRFFVSNDGVNWPRYFYSMGRAVHHVPDQIGVFVNPNNGFYPAAVTLESLVVA